MAKKERKVCCVVDQHCHDHDEDTANQRMPECFACGMSVCTRCSLRRNYMDYGVQRICHNCFIDHFGHDDDVMLHCYKQSGYKVTKSWIRALRLYKPQDSYPRETETLQDQIARWKYEFQVRQKRMAISS